MYTTWKGKKKQKQTNHLKGRQDTDSGSERHPQNTQETRELIPKLKHPLEMPLCPVRRTATDRAGSFWLHLEYTLSL